MIWIAINSNYSADVSAEILLFPINVIYETIKVKEIRYKCPCDSFSYPASFIQLLSRLLKPAAK